MKAHSLIYALLLALLSTGQALAHGFWIEQRYGRLEAIFGHGPAVEAYPSDHILGAWGYDREGKPIKIDIQRTDTHGLLIPRQPAALVTASLDSKFFRAERGSRGTNIKNAMIVLSEGANFEAAKDIRLVLIPDVDPLTVGPGQPLSLRVLLDGMPVANAPIMVDYKGIGTTGFEQSARTDEEGRATITVRNVGLNVIATFYAEEPGNGDRNALHTTLAFLGAPYEHL